MKGHDIASLVADGSLEESALPLRVAISVESTPPPKAIENLKKLQRLGILTGDALLALVAQAPIDPINLMGTLMRLHPDGWAFSAFDFSMVRVLARAGAPKKSVITAAMRVDLMGETITTMVINKAKQLTIYKTLEVVPSKDMLEKIQALCDEAVQAAIRELGN